jgi:hypothetical protein
MGAASVGKSRAAARRRNERRRSFLCEGRRRRRIPSAVRERRTSIGRIDTRALLLSKVRTRDTEVSHVIAF